MRAESLWSTKPDLLLTDLLEGVSAAEAVADSAAEAVADSAAAVMAAEAENTNCILFTGKTCKTHKNPGRGFYVGLCAIIIFMINASSSVIIIFLSFAGFLIAFYIRHHKKNVKEVLVCPLRANCDTVIHSDYSKFLGIPVEILGILYYGLIAVSYGLFIVLPETATSSTLFFVHSASALAFIFSIYLTLVQAFALKNWCTWCIVSAVISASIFLISFLG